MKDTRPHDDSWPDPATAEALLDGEPVADPRGLTHLLAAAAEPLPGRPQDERAALEAFRLARHTTRPATHRRHSRSAKVLLGGLAAALAFSGAALAAQTGTLPHPFRSAPTATATSPTTPRPPSSSPTPQPSTALNLAPASATAPTPNPAATPRPTESKTRCTSYDNPDSPKLPPSCTTSTGSPTPTSPPPTQSTKPNSAPTPSPTATAKATSKPTSKSADAKTKK